MRLPSLPVFTDAFVTDTIHLDACESGAYLMLLFAAWNTNECRLKNDDRLLARIARCTPAQWKKIKDTILEFWTIDGDYIFQKRLRKEYDYVSQKVKQNRANGSLGGKAKSLKNNKPAVANASQTLERKASEPSPTPNNTPYSPPAGGSASRGDDEDIIDLEFEKFWRAFPPGRKQDKLKAKRKYCKIVSNREPDLTASAAELLAGVERYAKVRASEPQRYTKTPFNWLAGGKWMDEDVGLPDDSPQVSKKPQSADDIWFDRLARKTYGSEQYDAMLAGGSK